MKIAIATLGSRGDVQPFLALAVALRRAGHDVRLATNDVFAELAASHGVELAPIAGDIKAIVGDRGRAALIASQGRPLASLAALREHVGPMIRDGLRRLEGALAGADVIMGQLLAPGAAHHAERHGLPYFDVGYVPIVPTRAFPHPGAPVTVPRGLASWASHVAAEQVLWQAFRPDVNAFRRRLGLGDAPLLGPSARPLARRPPALLGYSEALLPRPPDWPDQVSVTGAWMLDPPASFRPPPRLADFVSAGEPPFYVGFGSMTVEHPERTTREIVAALREVRCRAVLSTGWGGLASAESTDDLLFVGDVPHAWLFPLTAGVVHHGGAGTTAEALRAGVPQTVVPFLSDQPFWGHHVARAGVGPAPIPMGELRAERLATALRAMMRPELRARARALGERVRREPGAAGAVEAMHRHLDARRSRHGRSRRPSGAGST